MDRGPQVLDAVRRMCERHTANAYLELRRGLDSLGSIAATATFVGVLGTVCEIVTMFSGLSGDPAGLFPIYAGILAEALVPTAIGLAVSLTTLFIYRYLTARVVALHVEMNAASLQLIEQLRSTNIWTPAAAGGRPSRTIIGS